MEHDLRLTVFWALHLTLLGLFALEVAFILSIWLKARVPGLPSDASRWRKLRATISYALKLVFSRRIWVLLRTLVVDGMVHRRLYRKNLQRWLVHISVFGSWLVLGVISTVTGVIVEVLPLLGMSPEAAASIPLFGHLFHADVWWVALVNEVLGLVVMGGMLMVVYRRYVQKDPQLRTIPADTITIALLTVIAFSGFPAEAFRLLGDYTTAAGAFSPDPTMIPPERLPVVLYGVWGPQWAFAGYLSARILGSVGLSPGAWEVIYNVSFWFHFFTVTALLYYLPFSRFAHVIMSPVIVAYNTLRDQEKHGGQAAGERGLPPVAHQRGVMMAKNKVNLSHFTLRQLMEMEACTRCGECIETCPTFAEARNEEIHPLQKINRTKSFWKADHLGLLARLFGIKPATEELWQDFSEGVYQCTLCGRCHVVCPIQIDTRPLWIAQREMLVDRELHPDTMNRLRETVTTSYNISGDPNDNRLGWVANMPAQPEGLDRRKGAEVVYFVGCVAAFYPMVYSVPQSLVTLMDRASVNFTTMGGKEACCGFPLIIAGMGKDAHDLMRHNIESVRALGAKQLVAACPSCYHTWKHDYPRLIGEPLGFEVIHETEFLLDLIRSGALKPKPVNKTVTYHDPCDLGRNSGIYDAPREILEAIPGLTFVEMKDNRELALCCGGGGDVEMADAELTKAVGRRRMLQAQETGAELIITACQQCKRTLLGAARANKIRIRTLDISELLLEATE
jgi:heterodisulfide reductase subunit D